MTANYSKKLQFLFWRAVLILDGNTGKKSLSASGETMSSYCQFGFSITELKGTLEILV